jgi:flagellar protein FlbB
VSGASAISNLLKILFLILLIIVLILGGIFWFDRLDLLNYKRVTGPLSQYLPAFMQRGEQPLENDEFLLERAYIEKQEQRLQDVEKDLARREQELDDRGLLLSEQEAKLSEEAKRLEEQEKVLSEARRQYDNYKDNVRKQAEYFVGMPPKEAVERLQKLEDLLIVDILREMDRNAEETGTQSIVPYYLSLMDAERAASVQRKMTKVVEFEEL